MSPDRKCVLHLSTVHPRSDARIWIKEVSSLASALPHDVVLMIADGRGSDVVHNVRIVDLGEPPRGRIGRGFIMPAKAFRQLRRLRPAVVHFHDPELIFLGLLLKLLGYKVIYDVHEDVPRQVLEKHWMPLLLARPISWAMSIIEWLAGRVLAAIVAATPTIAARFPRQKTAVVQNFPILAEMAIADTKSQAERSPHFVYVGAISRKRGAREMVEAIHRITLGEARLILAGVFQPEDLKNELVGLPGWRRVDFQGWVSRQQVATLLSRVRGGLVVLHPTKTYPDAYPIKMFEYMAAGLPVIASNFPLWREIIDSAGCGLLVDPLDSRDVSKAMQWILDHPVEAEAMGQRGRRAVETKYNWLPEQEKLLSVYEALLLDA